MTKQNRIQILLTSKDFTCYEQSKNLGGKKLGHIGIFIEYAILDDR